MEKTLSPELIADLYEAAIDDARWPRFADIVARATGVAAAGVWVADKGRIVDMSSNDIQRETEAPYLAHFYKLDLWNQGLARHRGGVVTLACEHTPEDALVKTEFYNDFARQYGLFRPMGAMIDLGPGVLATVAIEQPFARRLFDSEDKRTLENVLPHMKRALQLRRRYQGEAPRAALRSAALDALAFGAIVCDAAGRVMFANAAAERLAARGAGIRLGGAAVGLRALAPGESTELARLVHDAGSGGAGGVARLTGADGATLLALVTPLPRSYNNHGAPGYALVALRAPDDDPAFSVDSLVALFKLSPAQAATAMAIYGGKSPEEIAAGRGVKISTVRTHLAEIFVRTGAENQRDLVRLLGTLPPIRRAQR